MHPVAKLHPTANSNNSHRRPSIVIHRILEESEDELDEDKRAHRAKKDGGASTPDKECADATELSSNRPIFNEEIARLKIKETDLVDLVKQDQLNVQQQQQQQQLQKTIPVRKEIPFDQRKQNMRRIGLLKRQPPGIAMHAGATADAAAVVMTTAPAAAAAAAAKGESGPRFDQRGRLIGHSILGSPADYYKLAVAKGHLRQDEVPPEAKEEDPEVLEGRLQKPPEPPPPPQPFPSPAADMAALNNWQLRMAERKRLQGRISKLLDRPISELLMNATDFQRTEIEDKDLIRRAMPFYDNGKGYRHGSEFWQQADRIGDTTTGIHNTLTMTQQGYPPPIERIGLSTVARLERGLPPSSDAPTGNTFYTESSSARSLASPRYPWKRYSSPQQPSYLHERKSELAAVIAELEPHKPDLRNLVVVGQNGAQNSGEMKAIARIESRPTTAVAPSVVPAKPTQELQHRVTGPSLLFGGQPARWLGDPHRYRGTPGIEARVILDTTVGQPTSQCLELENDGSTVLFYRWKRQEQPNPFSLAKSMSRRFYFDTGGGVLLPGELLHFPFIFKSNQPGLFTERWQLETTPSLLGGADLTIVLRGLAMQPDANAEIRAELEDTLAHRGAVRMVTNILNELLQGATEISQISSHSISQNSLDDTEAFLGANQSMAICRLGRSFWQPDTNLIAQLRRLHATSTTTAARGPLKSSARATKNKTADDDDWDLSVNSLRKKLLTLDGVAAISSASTTSSALSSSASVSAATASQQAVGRLYALVDARMSFQIDLGGRSLSQKRYVLCYGLVMDTMDRIFNFWHYQRFISGLPEQDTDFPDPSTRRSRFAGGRLQRQQQQLSSAASKGSGSARSSQRPRSVAKDERRSAKWQQQQNQKLLVQQRQQQQQQQLQQYPEPRGVEDSRPREAVLEQMCSEKVYAATYCFLAGLVEEAFDLFENINNMETAANPFAPSTF